MPPPWEPIDHILALDFTGRGIGSFFRPGAAHDTARALRRARRVLIATGFTVGPEMPETDGPPGAAVLGRALRTLGARVHYITDPGTVAVLEAALKALDEPAEITTYPSGDDAAWSVLARERPTHLVAIERPGRTRTGEYLNARGESVAQWNRPLDELFVWSGGREIAFGRGGPARDAAWRRPVTIGVGDGGNEIGMGNVRSKLLRAGPLMARIASAVRVDHLVVAGVSNWGAYGIVAELARLTARSLLHSASRERELVEACVDAGAFDGVTRRREATVDGLPLDIHVAVVELLGLVSRASTHRGSSRSGMIGP